MTGDGNYYCFTHVTLYFLWLERLPVCSHTCTLDKNTHKWLWSEPTWFLRCDIFSPQKHDLLLKYPILPIYVSCDITYFWVKSWKTMFCRLNPCFFVHVRAPFSQFHAEFFDDINLVKTHISSHFHSLMSSVQKLVSYLYSGCLIVNSPMDCDNPTFFWSENKPRTNHQPACEHWPKIIFWLVVYPIFFAMKYL